MPNRNFAVESRYCLLEKCTILNAVKNILEKII